MPRQSAVTVRAPLVDGAAPATLDVLRQIRAEGTQDGRMPFARLTGVHFARIFVLDAVTDLRGQPIAASVVYMADVDGTQLAHLRELATLAADGVDAVFGGCPGYPAAPTPAARAAWLSAHKLQPAARYVHTAGRGLAQIQAEARLHAALQDTADQVVPDGEDVRRTYRAVRDAVTSRPDLRWADAEPRRTGPSRLLPVLVLVPLGLLALVFLPLLLAGLAVALLLIRLHELRDVPEHGQVDPAHVQEVERYEDWATQNPFTAVGFVKAGLVRRTTMRVALFGLDLGNRLVFNRDNLAGVTSLHFARWVPLDGGRRLVFASSYDGSQESYMNDFIDRLAWGLNLVFSNGVGYPRTRWLIFGGARDETAFKRYLRRHQVPTVVWYSAYPTLHAPRIDASTQLRATMAARLSSARARQWLGRL